MFHFTIRDVLWLMVVVTVAAAVLYTRSARESDLRQATRRAEDQEMEAIRSCRRCWRGVWREYDEWCFTRAWNSAATGRGAVVWSDDLDSFRFPGSRLVERYDPLTGKSDHEALNLGPNLNKTQ
jgi:hypothetical protein